MDAIDKHTIVFGIAPLAPKTYLAVAMAVNALRSKEVNHHLDPASSRAGRTWDSCRHTERQIDPYLRPCMTPCAMMEGEKVRRLLDTGVIEVAPLAYMRGRTLNNAFVILDEAQNTTAEQMKMFLTRLGAGSKMVVTGDATQVDLPGGKKSGLAVARRVLEGKNEDIVFQDLTSEDVVRHSLVTAIVEAYGEYDEEMARKKANRHER